MTFRSRIIQGDALKTLRTLPSEFVQCVVTSPPYWGLRDYGVEGQMGGEDTPAAFVKQLRNVFREVRRVLRKDGTLWLNFGDSYAGSWGAQGHSPDCASRRNIVARQVQAAKRKASGTGKVPAGLKEKDLIGMPWRVAFALQADGWYLRSDIVWSKPNPMPESIADRPTKSHEYLFLLSQSPSYFYDAAAIRDPAAGTAHARGRANGEGAQGVTPKSAEAGSGTKANGSFHRAVVGLVEERNARTVWTIPSQPFDGAHFATFPEELARRCIVAGTSAVGACSKCGAPWRREEEKVAGPLLVRRSTGWASTCDCEAPVIPCVVLDPFAGSGTTCAVADAHQRSWVGIELNPEYAEMARRRVHQDGAPLFSTGPGP